MTSPRKSNARRQHMTRNRRKTKSMRFLLYMLKSPLMLILLSMSLLTVLFIGRQLNQQLLFFRGASSNSPALRDTSIMDNHDRQKLPLLTSKQFESHHLPESFQFLKDILVNNEREREGYDSPLLYLGSDVVDLSYCDLSHVDWTNFTVWSVNAYESKWQELKTKFNKQKQRKMELTKGTAGSLLVVDWQRAEEEIILQMLEIYANYKGFCDYSKFQPTVPQSSFNHNKGSDGDRNSEARTTLYRLSTNNKFSTSKTTAVLQSSSSSSSSSNFARLAIVIAAYKDSSHLSHLIEAIHMPQHYIVIHIERQTPPDFESSVRTIASRYSNVVVLKFGTVAYQTDSISHVNLQIMRWMTFDLQLPYDYFLTLGGAVYPLVTAQHLARTLHESKRRVFLGEITHGGRFVSSSQTNYLQPRRLRLTVDKTPKVFLPRMKPSTLQQGMGYNILDSPMFRNLSNVMNYKTNSGNQAIYSHETVTRLLSSSEAMKIFGLSKYGCCCCIEERNWIAAMVILGLKDEALNQHASMFQLWDDGMGNAILHTNSSTIFRLEDASGGIERDGTLDFSGAELMSYLKQAKKRGLLFARKFSSDHDGSMTLLKNIQKELH